MTGARTLIRNGIVLPISATHPRSVLDPGSVLLEGLEIADVGPVEMLDRDPRSQDAVIVDATEHAVLPGLHNCHLHSGLLRGTSFGSTSGANSTNDTSSSDPSVTSPWPHIATSGCTTSLRYRPVGFSHIFLRPVNDFTNPVRGRGIRLCSARR